MVAYAWAVFLVWLFSWRLVDYLQMAEEVLHQTNAEHKQVVDKFQKKNSEKCWRKFQNVPGGGVDFGAIMLFKGCGGEYGW